MKNSWNTWRATAGRETFGPTNSAKGWSDTVEGVQLHCGAASWVVDLPHPRVEPCILGGGGSDRVMRIFLV